jgi:arsenate reductase (thioredoxin)
MPVVLFLGEAGAARAPLAEAITRHLRPDLEVWSACGRPSHVRPHVRLVLEEEGISAVGLRARAVGEVDLDEVDLVVALCPDNRRPHLPSRFVVVPAPMSDPTVAPDDERYEAFRACRDSLLDRIPRLLDEHLG